MTFEEWKAENEVSYRMMSADVLCAYLGGLSLTHYVESLSDSKGKMLNKRINANGTFDFNPNTDIGASNLAYIDELVARNDEYKDVLILLKDEIIAYCKQVTTKNLLQYNQSQGIYTSIEKPFSTEIKLQVTGCEERCPAVVYGLSDDYDEPQNLGCTAYGQSKFVFDLSKAKRFETVEIRFPYKGVEVI